MQNIKFGTGTFVLRDMDDHIICCSDTDECIATIEDYVDEECDVTIFRKEIQALMAGEATFEIKNMKIHRQLWYRLAHGIPWQWPVSNNWLKMHGYDMRRRRQIRKTFPWLLKILAKCHE